MQRYILFISIFAWFCCFAFEAKAAAPAFRFTVNVSEAVDVTTTGGTPRIALDVGGQTRYASYTSGTGAAALTFTYAATSGDLDLDGIGISSPIDLNGGAIADLAGNAIDAGDLAFTPPDTSNVNISYPSLSMDFTSGSTGTYSYNGTVYNSFSAFQSASSTTFTNDGNGTYFDSSGVIQQSSTNTPRFDHDPVTHEPKGILIEETRTNLVNDSHDLSTWGEDGIATHATSSEASPIQGNTYNLVDVGAAGNNNGPNRLSTNVPVSGNTTYAFSAFFKNNDADYMTMRMYCGGTVKDARVDVDLVGKSLSNLIQVDDAYVVDLGGNDLRVVMIVTTNADNTSCNIRVGGSISMSASGQLFYVDGVQLETGAFPTSYIPTSGSTVTRAREVFRVPVSSGWYNQSEGSVYAEALTNNVGNATSYIFQVDDEGGGGNRILMRFDSFFTARAFSVVNNDTSFLVQSGAVQTSSAFVKLASGFEANNLGMSLDGNSVASNSSGSMPATTMTRLNVGSNQASFILNGNIKALRYYPLRVSDTQLQLLSTP